MNEYMSVGRRTGADARGQSDDLAFLRQFLRSVYNDAFAGDEVTALLADDLDRPEAGRGDLLSRNRLMLGRGIRRWRELAKDPATGVPFHRYRLLQRFDPNGEAGLFAGILIDVFQMDSSAGAQILDVTIADIDRLLHEERVRRPTTVEGRALIIEDNAIIAADLIQTLHEIGLSEATESATVEHAVAAARAQPHDLVISDFDLGPGGKGIDAVNEILEHADIPVIFVTAFPEEVLTGAGQEPTFVMAKPYHPDALKAAVIYALTLPTLTMIDADAEDQPQGTP